jgi:hypothetical protein
MIEVLERIGFRQNAPDVAFHAGQLAIAAFAHARQHLAELSEGELVENVLLTIFQGIKYRAAKALRNEVQSALFSAGIWTGPDLPGKALKLGLARVGDEYDTVGHRRILSFYSAIGAAVDAALRADDDTGGLVERPAHLAKRLPDSLLDQLADGGVLVIPLADVRKGAVKRATVPGVGEVNLLLVGAALDQGRAVDAHVGYDDTNPIVALPTALGRSCHAYAHTASVAGLPVHGFGTGSVLE